MGGGYLLNPPNLPGHKSERGEVVTVPDFRLLNGGKKATVLERFDGSVLLLCGGSRREFGSLAECKKQIEAEGIEVNVYHLFGSSLKRELICNPIAKEG